MLAVAVLSCVAPLGLGDTPARLVRSSPRRPAPMATAAALAPPPPQLRAQRARGKYALPLEELRSEAKDELRPSSESQSRAACAAERRPRRDSLPRLRSPRTQGHTYSGVQVSAAGIVPYVDLRGDGVHFLLQKILNGTRAGKLSDFGGRREPSDKDIYFTAAREFTEETGGAFGDPYILAERLRSDPSVKILNRRGKYLTFFLKVDYIEPQRLPEVDETARDVHARTCRWWRADELLGRVSEEGVLARMINPHFGRAKNLRVGRLSSFHTAVCRTLDMEKGNVDGYERWHSNSVEKSSKAGNRKWAEVGTQADYMTSTAMACAGGAVAYTGSRPRRADARRSNSKRSRRATRIPPLDLRDFAP